MARTLRRRGLVLAVFLTGTSLTMAPGARAVVDDGISGVEWVSEGASIEGGSVSKLGTSVSHNLWWTVAGTGPFAYTTAPIGGPGQFTMHIASGEISVGRYDFADAIPGTDDPHFEHVFESQVCAGPATVVVDQLERGTGGEIVRFAAHFTQFCPTQFDGPRRMWASVAYRATVPIRMFEIEGADSLIFREVRDRQLVIHGVDGASMPMGVAGLQGVDADQYELDDGCRGEVLTLGTSCTIDIRYRPWHHDIGEAYLVVRNGLTGLVPEDRGMRFRLSGDGGLNTVRGGEFHGLSTPRVLVDTALGIGAVPGPLSSGPRRSMVTFRKAGIGTGATGLVATVTVTPRSTSGAPTEVRIGSVEDHDDEIPAVVAAPGRVTTEFVTAPLDRYGRVFIAVDGGGPVDVRISVQGWIGPTSERGSGLVLQQVDPAFTYQTGVPGRKPLAAREARLVAGWPHSRFALVQVTATAGTKATNLTLYQPGTTRGDPQARLLAGETQTFVAIVPQDASGRFRIHNSAGTVSVRITMIAPLRKLVGGLRGRLLPVRTVRDRWSRPLTVGAGSSIPWFSNESYGGGLRVYRISATSAAATNLAIGESPTRDTYRATEGPQAVGGFLLDYTIEGARTLRNFGTAGVTISRGVQLAFIDS